MNYRHINALTVSNTYPAISILAPAKGATGFTAWATRYFTVSIHAPTKGATITFAIASELFSVSIHAPTKGATVISFSGILSRYVSIHAPTKGATSLDGTLSARLTFQSTLLRKERRAQRREYTRKYRAFQSTLLRKERLEKQLLNWRVSTFQSTLLRKERPGCTVMPTTQQCFNPRSYERSDRFPPYYYNIFFRFNPRSYERSDDELCYDISFLIQVSIHAPTKGATAILHKSSSDFVLFLSNYTSSCFTLQAG